METKLMRQEESRRGTFLDNLQYYADVQNSYPGGWKDYSSYKSRLKRSYQDYLAFVEENHLHDLLTPEIRYMYLDYFDREPEDGTALQQLLDYFGEMYKGMNSNLTLQKRANAKAMKELEVYVGSPDFEFIEE